MSDDRWAIAFVVFIFGVVGAAIIGWILNIVAIAKSTEIINAMFILRCIGVILAPIGAVLGYV